MNRCLTGFTDVLMQYGVCVCVFAVGAAIGGAVFAFPGVLRLPLCSWPCPPCPGMAGSFEGEEGGGSFCGVAVARDEAARADKEESRLHQRLKNSDGRACGTLR